MTILYGRNGVLAEGQSRFSSITVTDDDTDLTVQFTTDISLTSGRAGFAYGVNDSNTPYWIDIAGAASVQTIVIALSEIGAVSTDTVYVDVGYSLTDPAVDKVYASDYGIGVSSRVI